MRNKLLRRGSALLIALLGLTLPGLSLAQINITVNGALGDLDGNGDGGAGEAAVVQAVVGCWSARVLTPRNFTLNLATANLSGGTIGQGAVSASVGGIPTAGNVTMDSPRAYFVDPTPLANTEFPTPDPASQWRLTGGTGTDLYSVVEHEVGHALAWVCAVCGFPNPLYDGLMNPAPGSFVSDPTCAPPFPVAGQPQPAGCVRLQAGGAHPLNVPLRGDGLGGSGSSQVNELSHPGVTGDLMLGFYTGGTREMQSVDDVDVFFHAYGDAVNLPLSVNAGNDIVEECDEFGGSDVQLDGSGTTDPEGDAITYSWSCPGVSLSSAGTTTPGGFFPVGQTINCRLDATDQAACPPDADLVSVTVQDTTAPTVNCPLDVTVECTGDCGIDADDPQLAAFFASFSASDTCDSSLDAGHDAPAFFELGDTVVTYTATDDFNNQNSCFATVTVEDTQDPTVEMELDRDVLWPPNHRMVEINAVVTVEDVCDPNAGFVLTSITSNEPDEGLGDGDFPNDIQEADTGTDDVTFLLRAERSGTGDGRVYTVVYTGSDKSGNDTEVSATVRVPHDRKGLGKPSEGYTEDGTELLIGATTYAIVILSSAELDATEIQRTVAEVGNTVDVIPPLATRTEDLNCDGRLDLKLYYPASQTIQLAEISGEHEPVGMRYETTDGTGYLIPDIFGLGPRLEWMNCSGSTGTAWGLQRNSGP